MKSLSVIFLALFFSACSISEPYTPSLPPDPSHMIDGVSFVSGNWEPSLPAGEKGFSLGNHRAVVSVPESGRSAAAVRVRIPWRRLDSHPDSKAIVVVDSLSGAVIKNSYASSISSEEGVVVFQPRPGSGTYFVYYLPWESTGGYYPKVTYPSQAGTPDSDWVTATKNSNDADLQEASTTRIESVNDFHSFFPMEIPATPEEKNAYLSSHDPDWTVIPEYGRFPIRMRHQIPYHWTTRESGSVTPVASKGEYLVFQLGVYAVSTSLHNVSVTYSGFDERLNETLTCINCEGTQFTGEPITFVLDVPEGEIQPLWIGTSVPENMPPGDYAGQITVTTSDQSSRTVDMMIRVLNQTIENHGFDDPASQSRLAWLNSTVGRDNDFIIAPYLPVTFEDHTLSILGRNVVLGATGLPDAINSFFTEEMTGVSATPLPILASPVELKIETASGTENFISAGFSIQSAGRGRATWTGESSSDKFEMSVRGALEYDGMLEYDIVLVARTPSRIDNISVPVTYDPGAATYLMGLGNKGGKRPASIDWKWKVENHQEGVWMGAVNRGLQYVLRDDKYVRPLNTNFYQNQPLIMPEAWFNDGNGGIRISSTENAVVADNYSGPRSMSAGDSLHFSIRFLITPFRALDTKTHFNTRFVHKYVPVDSVIAWGGTVVNIHHANEINPYINYPFYNLDLQTAYIQEAHSKGIKVKLYNTIRELTYKAHELFAMRSLGEEIFNGGEGGGHSWLQEHLRDNYHSAWHAFNVDDAAILNKGTSRWTNYYIEGLSWLADKQQIDGLYLDDIAFSRETVKRMISVLHAQRDEVVIDLHSANQFNPRDGFTNSAMLYMEHFPFISRLWFGEYFEYGLDPDYWMTEVSGLPFGLMGEMLQDGGHPYRGMLYGMTTRLYGDIDPRPVWGLMNNFGISESRMLGYWLSKPPVTTDANGVLATAFVREGSSLIALASWSDRDETVHLNMDLEALGLNADATWTIPGVTGLQEAQPVSSDHALLVPANQGLFILVTNKKILLSSQ